METHLLGRHGARLDREGIQELFASMDTSGNVQENVQEYVGSWKDPVTEKYLYRLVVDFDCVTDIDQDELLARAGKFTLHTLLNYRSYIVDRYGQTNFFVNVVFTKRRKVVDGRPVDRWHVHYTDIVFVSDQPRQGASILTPVKETVLRSIDEVWPDFDAAAGSLQWLVYGSRKFGADSSYEYSHSVCFLVDLDTKDVSVRTYDTLDYSRSQLRDLLSMHREIDAADIIVDWTRIPTRLDDDDDGVVPQQESEDDGYVIQSHCENWGDVEVNPLTNRLRINYPPETGVHAVKNPDDVCIQLATAYKGIDRYSSHESHLVARSRVYVFRWALLKLVFIAQYATKYDTWYRLLLIIASNMSYKAGLRLFRVLSSTDQSAMKDDPEYHYNKAVAWLWRHTPPDALDTDGEEYISMCGDNEVDGETDFVTSRSGQLVPNSEVRRGTKRKNRQQEESSSSSSSRKNLNIPRRIVRLQYESFFQMTDEDRETSNWLLTTL